MYPAAVEVNTDNILKLTTTFKRAYSQIISEINGATDFGRQNRKQLLAQIDDILDGLGEKTNTFIQKELPMYYEAGASDAIKQLNNVDGDIQVAAGFNRIHQDAIAAIVDDTARAFGESMTGVSRSANLLLNKATRDLLTQKMAEGTITGAALREVRQNIKGILAEQGLSALVDKGGNTWSLDRYAEMLFRTKAVEARNRGLANRMVENGYDLVQVSSHNSNHEACRVWEGQILSVTGDSRGYPTVTQAEQSGLFHPNCKHAINALIPSLAKLTRAYDPTTGEYLPPGQSLNRPIYDRYQKVIAPAIADFQDEFRSGVEKVADNLGVDYSHGNPKKPERAAQKIVLDYNAQISELKDSARSVIFISDPNSKKEFDAIVAGLKKEFDVTRVKNGLGEDAGYVKAMVNIQTPTSTQAEIQITTKEMWEAKKELGGDDLYKIVRIKEKEWQQALEKMNQLYDQAREEAARRLASN